MSDDFDFGRLMSLIWDVMTMLFEDIIEHPFLSLIIYIPAGYICFKSLKILLREIIALIILIKDL